MKFKILLLAILANLISFSQDLKCDFSLSQGPDFDYFSSYNYGVVAEDDKYFYVMMDFLPRRDIKTLTISQYDAQTLTLDGDLDASEYRKLKIELEEEIEKLEAEENKIKLSVKNYESQIDVCAYLVKNLQTLYQLGDTAKKQKVVSSIFPKKLILENKKCRTPFVNEAVLLLCKNSKAFKGGKKEKYPKIEILSLGVVP